MLYRRSITKGQVRASMHPWRGSQLSLSLCARVFHSNTRMYVRLLGPCFKTGRLKPLCQHPECKHWVPQSQPLYMNKGYNTSEDATFPNPLSNDQNWCWPIQTESTPDQWSGWFLKDVTDFKRFPFNNFTYCLTLFSKFFSSFPHGTCALSVSRQYLALDGIYHPFRAAFPNNSTHWERITKALVVCAKDGIVTLYDALFQGTYAQSSADNTSLIYNSDSQRLPDFKFELFPLHSQLLGESLLVSFPPLIDMLKFSG
jgi:hypothetical protein